MTWPAWRSARPGPARTSAVAATVVAVAMVAACGSAKDGRPASVTTSVRPTGSPAAPAPSTAAVAPVSPSSSAVTEPAPASSTAPGERTPTGPSVTLAFGGDVHFMGVDASRLAADPATALGPIASVLGAADLAMVNLETAVTTGGTPAAKQFNFRAPPTAFAALRAAGVDVVTMANNHGEDYGPAGLTDTLAAAAAAKFPVVGIGADEDAAFTPYTVTLKGQRLAIIGATQVLDGNLAGAWTAGPGKAGLASAKDVPRLLEAVRSARASADTVVVYLHWGKELAACPTDSQRTVAKQLVDAGADIVVGSHAHVQLGAGRLGSAYVDYGLGNFVFYARGTGVTSRSGVLVLTVAGRAVTKASWSPAQIEGGVPVPLSGALGDQAVEHWRALAACTGLAALG